VLLAVCPVEAKRDAGMFANRRVYRLETMKQLLQWDRLDQCEIKIFGKPVVAEVASLQGSSPFECQHRFQIRFRQRHQESGQTIISFQDLLGKAAPTDLRQSVGEK